MAASTKLSPAMEQFMRIKQRHQDAILFFRMGDFYEMFFDDAKEASRLLGLTLTTRNHGRSSGAVPLAGVPHHSADQYVAKLVQMGRKVAICEQVEDPKEAKGIVDRDVVQVVSPGTALADTMLDGERNNFTVALVPEGDSIGIAAVDLSTGDFFLDEVAAAELGDELLRLAPAEILLGQSLGPEWSDEIARTVPGVAVSRLEDWQFEHGHAYEALTEQLGVHSLKSFDCEDVELGVRAAGGALEYLRENQRGGVRHINRIQRRRRFDHLYLDSAAQRHLELFANQQDSSRAGTLIDCIDRTRTPLGARALRQWLAHPLKRVAAIEKRLDSVSTLVAATPVRAGLRRQLDEVGDLERLVARICCGRANARDIAALASSLNRTPAVVELLQQLPAEGGFEASEFSDTSELVELIATALVDEPPAATSEGGLFRDGYCEELDDLRKVQSGGVDWIAALQASERERSGIASLKVGFNQVFGYYIEISKANLERVPDDYVRKQTLTNAERYITPDLKERETQILNARERIAALESQLFDELRERVAAWAPQVQQNARAFARVDVLAALAEVAVVENYSRPAIDDSGVLELAGARHVVVERQMSGGRFVPNDLYVDRDQAQILLITGPNMAGKSTLIRQLGLIVVLAQVGSYVPAKSARIGVVDRVFTRVGASDNLARGESTFMVEMIEAATILNNVTSRSLILMDELGRGTSTFDGLSLAWAIVEYLHDRDRIQPRTLFATHYHELTELEQKLERVVNYNVMVREEENRVVFLHRLARGPCDRSYGIHVAGMAGMPSVVIARAREILARLEGDQINAGQIAVDAGDAANKGLGAPQMDLFDDSSRLRAAKRLLDEIAGLDLLNTTPLQALETLHRWRESYGEEDPSVEVAPTEVVEKGHNGRG